MIVCGGKGYVVRIRDVEIGIFPLHFIQKRLGGELGIVCPGLDNTIIDIHNIHPMLHMDALRPVMPDNKIRHQKYPVAAEVNAVIQRRTAIINPHGATTHSFC
ncbi:hypothetical protein D3C81_1142960 [compost metagenome]